MDWLASIVLGLLQGLTEFLPISSSGHLIIAQELLGIQSNQLLLNILMHVGTMGAVVLVLWKDIVAILRRPFNKMTLCLVIATIPAAVVGFLSRSVINEITGNINGFLLGGFFLITALILWFGGRLVGGRKRADTMGYRDALVMGLGQALAVLPGVSRSGTTIIAGEWMGLDRNFAARFSLLMSIPIILGSAIFEIGEAATVGVGDFQILPVLFGMLMAFVAGILAIRFLLKIVERNKMSYFSIYTAALGLFLILDAALLHVIF